MYIICFCARLALSLYCKLYAKNKMKKIFVFLFIYIITFPIYGTENILFQYPQAPENLTTLSQRANYVVEHFWDKCNLKSAFYSRKKMKKAYFEITNVCNLSCSFCPKTKREKRFVSLGEFISVAEKLRGKIEYLYLQLGIRFLHGDLSFLASSLHLNNTILLYHYYRNSRYGYVQGIVLQLSEQ